VNGTSLNNTAVVNSVPGGIRLLQGTVAFRSQSHESNLSVALKDVDFQVQYGEMVALAGPNGSGKSTLARVLAGVLPLSKGWLHQSPADSRSRSGPGLAEEIGAAPRVQLIFQNPDAQMVGETVFEDVAFGLENYCYPSENIEEQVMRALAQVHLENFVRQPVQSLSGGQKALLCIASALAVEAGVLIFDEATAMLDVATRQQVLTAAKQLHEDGTTVIWVTQWMDEVAQFPRVVGLDSGTVQFDGHPRDFFYGHPSPCRQLGLVPPYAVEVCDALRRQGVPLPGRPVTLDDLAEEVASLWR